MTLSKSWVAWQSIIHGRRLGISPYEAVKFVKQEIEAFNKGEVIDKVLHDVLKHKKLWDM